MPAPKKKKKCEEGVADWMLTYGDMTTLLLTFFVMMFTTAEIDGYELKLILAAFNGLGVRFGGNTLQAGRLAELGNTVMSLPSRERGQALDKARRLAVSQFQPELMSEKVKISIDERGLVISITGDALFEPGSAEVEMENNRDMLRKLAKVFEEPEFSERFIRIEGHTDDTQRFDPDSEYPTNWELSSARAVNTLKALMEFGVDDENFQVAGYADNRPVAPNDTREGRVLNNRVDIVLISEGHL